MYVCMYECAFACWLHKPLIAAKCLISINIAPGRNNTLAKPIFVAFVFANKFANLINLDILIGNRLQHKQYAIA